MSSLRNAEVIMQLQKEIAQLKKLNGHYPPSGYDRQVYISSEANSDNNRYQNNKVNQSLSTSGNKQLVQKILNSSSSRLPNSQLKPFSNRSQPQVSVSNPTNFSAQPSQVYLNNQKNNSFDLQINSLDEESSERRRAEMMNNNNTRARNGSGVSIDLTRFKIGQDDLSSFAIKSSMSKKKEYDSNEQLRLPPPNTFKVNNLNQTVSIPNLANITNGSNANRLNSMSSLGGIKTKKALRDEELVTNISVSASNYKFIMYTRQMKDEEENKMRSNDITPIPTTSNCPSEYKKLFTQAHKASSRRMIVEMAKVLLKKKKPNESLSSILTLNKIPMVVLSSMETIDQSEPKQSKFYRGSNITLGELPELSKNKEQRTGFFFPKSNQVEDVKYLDQFLNRMDDEAEEKATMLNFLVIPRVMNMVVNMESRYPFLFVLTPSNMSSSVGIEDYLFKWKDCRAFSVVGWFDLLNLKTCTVNFTSRNQFEIVVKNDNDTAVYLIEANNEDIAKQYVNSINYIAQLIKCRVFYSKNGHNSTAKAKKY